MGSGRKIDTVFVLVVFCVFAVSVLTMLTLGVSAYSNMTSISREGDNEQTSLTYIWSKVKNNDGNGRVSVDLFHDIPALCIDEEYSGAAYRTRIYFYDGWVRELFGESDLDFMPEDGIPVVEASSLSVESMENGIIKAVSGGKSLLISPRGEMGRG